MKATVMKWRQEFRTKVVIWLAVMVPLFIGARILIWETLGKSIVQREGWEEYSDYAIALVGAVLFLIMAVTMAWYFHRLFYHYFDLGYQKLLRQAESERDHYQALFEGFPAMIWRTNTAGLREYCNDQWRQFTGRAEAEEAGTGWQESIHAEDREGYQAALADAMRSGRSISTEYRLRRQDGVYRWVHDYSRPLANVQGKITGYLGACYDITEQREMLEQLRESEERFRGLLSCTPDGIIVHRFGEIVYLNQTMCEILRLESDRHAIGKTAYDFVHPDQHAEVRERIRQRAAGITHFPPLELQLVRADGTLCESEITATVMKLDGEPAIIVFVRDITDRKLAEKRLEEDAIRHRIFVEQSLDGIVVLDEDGAVTESNRRFAEMLGYSLDEMAKLHVWDWDLRWSADELRSMIRQTDALAVHFETRQRRKDGTFVDVDITSTSAICNGRKLIFCVCRDISQRKQAEAALRESERVLASLMDNLPGMAFRRQMRPEMVLEFVSGGSTNIFGYDPEELIDAVNTRNLPEIHPEDVEAVEAARRESITDGTPLNVAYRIRHRRGDYRWVSEQASPTYAGSPRRSYLEGIVYDVDERYQLQMRQSLLNAAIEAADEAIVVADVEGRIEYVNPAFTRVTGYSLEEAIGKSPNILRSGKHGEQYYEELWGTIARGEIWRGDLINVAKDGHEFEEQATISPVLDSSGKIVHYVAVKHDMTLQRNLERQLLQSQKLEAVGILAGGIAHDFNNLLTVIIGHSHMLLKRIPEDDPHAEDVAQILETGNRAAALTRQLLAYSRKQVSRPQSVSLNTIIENFRKMLSRIVDENIVLTTELVPEIPNVVIDPSHVEQVILNLVVNARDAMPHGGKLTLTTGVKKQKTAPAALGSQLEPGEYVVLTCTDSGCGMDEATMRRVFDPFFTTKDVGKGTGLGLSTVYGIVNQAHGAISIESEPGKGTTFEVWLPIEESVVLADQIRNDEASLAHSPEGKLICLVEDEEAIRKLVRRILQHAGYRVMEADCGEAAMQMIEECREKPDLLLTDVIMPGINGKDLANDVLRRYAGCKVVFMSGYTDDVLERNGALSDICQLIMKPFQPEELLKLVAKTLESADSATTVKMRESVTEGI